MAGFGFVVRCGISRYRFHWRQIRFIHNFDVGLIFQGLVSNFTGTAVFKFKSIVAGFGFVVRCGVSSYCVD